VVSTTFEVTAYRTLWFAYSTNRRQSNRGDGREWRARDGALVRRRAGRRRPPAGQFAAFKDVVGDMLDKGVFTPSTARQYLKRKLAERVGDRQELRIPTGESPFEKASLNRS